VACALSDRSLQRRMLRRILRDFPVRPWSGRSGAFSVLVGTILSQNTNDRNSDLAYRRLARRFQITPEVLSGASVGEIIDSIRVAGLYKSKSRNIKRVSEIVLRKYNGRLTSVLHMPAEEARNELMALPGVGPKTADILLAFVAGRDVIPVDTHITRVSNRLGIVPRNARYELIRARLEELVPPKERLRMHLSMIRFGRETCRAPRPKCVVCPINRSCPSSTI